MMDKSPDVAGRRKRLVALCRALPEAEVERAGAQHLAFKVRKKIFGYYAYDHHGDGRIALLCKAPPGEQSRLLDEDPERYFFPPYVGPRGWIGLRLDTPRVDWRTVTNIVRVSYFLTAPGRRGGEGRRWSR
jgi:phosphoribosylglycinamide formyltransferase-1